MIIFNTVFNWLQLFFFRRIPTDQCTSNTQTTLTAMIAPDLWDRGRISLTQCRAWSSNTGDTKDEETDKHPRTNILKTSHLGNRQGGSGTKLAKTLAAAKGVAALQNVCCFIASAHVCQEPIRTHVVFTGSSPLHPADEEICKGWC